MRAAPILALLLCAVSCRVQEADEATPATERGTAEEGIPATAFGSGSERLDPAELERERMHMDWRAWTDGAVSPADSPAPPSPAAREAWDSITVESVNRGAVLLPVHGDVAGPSVLRVQILLDRAHFSPGIIDGRWGRNTEKAVYWFQEREALEPTGSVDEHTWRRLVRLAGSPDELVRTQVLTSDDVSGPFVTLPADAYDRRDMDCQCYESLVEKLAERFHTTPELLDRLNPGIDLNAVGAGASLNVPALAREPMMGRGSPGTPDREPRENGMAGAAPDHRGDVARIIISDGGRYIHAVDANGRILYHFPATLGSDYSPSPTGEYHITNIAFDPTWHYQPARLEGVDESLPDAVLPPGPNNAVGIVWMQLSRPHYGIHGTSAPETIGYTTSSGCVRMTNWDAAFLGTRVRPGTPVVFRDVR